jgi:NAD+ synthase
MKIDAPFVEKILTQFIKSSLYKFGYSKGILGLSGGLDSSTCASLAAKALKPENVIGLIMPYGETFSNDVKDAEDFAKKLGISYEIINISAMVDAYFKEHPTQNRILKGNKMARERMSILYDFSARKEALILGTSNKTELLLGYGTIHGDMASAINPIGDLYKTQIQNLAIHLDIPENIRRKIPSAGLWKGQTDEKELGLAYDKIDQILFHIVDKRKSKKAVLSLGFSEPEVNKVIGLIKKSEFKRKLPPIVKISERSIGHDFLFPHDREK